jgi:hypothetical protein
MAGLLDGLDLGKDVKAFKTSTNTAMRSVRGDTLTPINTTTARLDEGVALVNPQDTTLKDRISNYRGQYIEQLDGVVSAISGGLLNTKDITKAIKVGRNGVVFDTDNILYAASSKLGFPVSSEKGAMRKLASSLNKEFNRLTGLNVDQLLTVDGESFRVGENWRGQIGESLLDNLVDYAGIDEFVDVSLKTSLYNSVIYNSSIFGMSDIYKNLWDNYPYEGLRQDAFIEAINIMIKNGDIISVDVVMGMLDEQGKNALLNKYPNFIEQLFSNFKFDANMLQENYPALKVKLLAILERVAGPRWMYRDTQFGEAYNLGLVSTISEDMITLLSPVTVEDATNEYIPLLATSGMFKEQSALDVLDKSFDNPPIILMS